MRKKREKKKKEKRKRNNPIKMNQFPPKKEEEMGNARISRTWKSSSFSNYAQDDICNFYFATSTARGRNG